MRNPAQKIGESKRYYQGHRQQVLGRHRTPLYRKRAALALRKWRRLHPDKVREARAKQKARLNAKLARADQFKGGQNKQDETAARVDTLYSGGMAWADIKAQMDTATRTHRTIDAYQNLRKRWLARHKTDGA